MNSQARRLTLAAAYLIFWVILGIWVLPFFQRIFAELLEGRSLPWSTVKLLQQGPVGCVGFGLTGATVIVVVESIGQSRALRLAVLLALCLPLVGAVGVLLWPLSSL